MFFTLQALAKCQKCHSETHEAESLIQLTEISLKFQQPLKAYYFIQKIGPKVSQTQNALLLLKFYILKARTILGAVSHDISKDFHSLP